MNDEEKGERVTTRTGDGSNRTLIKVLGMFLRAFP